MTVFHIDHGWLSYLPEIMKPVEAVLEGSEIPELFGDEIETIANPLRNAAQLDGYQESITSYFWTSKLIANNIFVMKVKKMLLFRSQTKRAHCYYAGNVYKKFE